MGMCRCVRLPLAAALHHSPLNPTPMISIITAVHNQLAMNRLFWQYLLKYTDTPFELIVIDNASTDGSRSFFASLAERGVRVIANERNYSYPHCQNQGIDAARGDVLVFLNNDLLVSPHWDSRLLSALGRDGREVLSLASNDRLFDRRQTQRISRRWKRIKYPIIYLMGQNERALKLMTALCYGNWERFADNIFRRYGYTFTTGMSGAAIAMTRRAIALVGKWDPTQQAGDFDLFYRTCRRAETCGDIVPVAVLNGVFVHHYRRLTLYSKYPPFADQNNLTSIETKWHSGEIARWNRYIHFEAEWGK